LYQKKNNTKDLKQPKEVK